MMMLSIVNWTNFIRFYSDKVQKKFLLGAPTVSSVSPTSVNTGDGTGNHTIIINGTNFDASATFKIRTDSGTDIEMDSVARNSAIKLTGTVAKNTSGITNANEPFDIVITIKGQRIFQNHP